MHAPLVLCAVAALAPIAPPAAQELDADNVVILLDASGSMKDPMDDGSGLRKMDAAKRAIAEVIARVPRETQAGLLVFSGDHKKDDWVFPLGPRDDEALIVALERLGPDGGTPLGEYMKKAADRLLEQREKQSGYGTYRMLIVTDGQANKDDQPLVDAYLPDILARGIVVDVIGVAMDDDHLLARRVHSYRRANDLDALQRAISEVFAEVGRQDGAGTAAAEGYELLAAFPDEAVGPVLAALTELDHAPIGAAVAEWSQPGPFSAHPSRRRGGASPGAFAAAAIVCAIFAVAIARRRRRRRA